MRDTGQSNNQRSKIMKKSRSPRGRKAIIPIAIAAVLAAFGSSGCATSKPKEVTPDQAAKLDRQLVKDAVIYEPGTEKGATVPEISAPRLHAILVPERVENNRLVERHREWILEGDVTILGIPKKPESKEK
jgi:hypothetical protein